MTRTGGTWRKDPPERPGRDVLRSGYLAFNLKPMLHIVTGNVSTRGKQIVGPLSYFIMGGLGGDMGSVAF